jgi:excisionase family DNA binding protein
MELMTLQEAADALRVSTSTVRTLCKNGQLPFIKLGRRVMFRRDSLDKYLNNLETVISGDK